MRFGITWLECVRNGCTRAAGRPPIGIFIRIHLQRIFWQFLSRLLKGFALCGFGLYKLAMLLFVPARILARMVFSVVLVNVYKFYLLGKKQTERYWRPAKNPILFPFSTRNVVHGMLILATLFVATNSIKAREIRQEELVQPTILSGMLNVETDVVIVETSDSMHKTSSHYVGSGGVSFYDVGGGTDNDFDLAATQDASSLLKQEITGTEEGVAPRSDVVYYVVESGETVSTIAQKYHVSINTILWENRLGDTTLIQPGQKLTILPTTGISYRVQSGDTLAGVVNKFGGQVSDIVAFNKLANDSAIAQNQVLIIPGGKPPAPPAVVPTSRLASYDSRAQASASADFDGEVPTSAPRPGEGLYWPTDSHKINQYYRWGHTGVDIDNAASSSPIFASQDGHVITAGWGGGYGLEIVIDHGNGMRTLYGHASRIFVHAGQYVERGQTIAIQGCTGRCTGTHLHFEVQIGGRRVNPLSYL